MIGSSPEDMAVSQAESGGPRRFGWFSGVFTPSILTILGVIMYLRFGWVVGQVGLGGALLIVALSHLITGTTGLSIASIATNRRVRTGGAYYMISRSLGSATGASIGIPLFLAQALSITFYVVGFVESLSLLVPELDARLWGSIVLVLLTAISLRSAELAIRVQYFVMGAIALSLLSFFLGSSPHPPSEITWFANGAPFASVFAVFFPAVTGIMAGVSMSGDLRDPRSAIPRGTMVAIAVGLAVYLVIPLLMALRLSPEQMVRNRYAMWSVSLLPQLIYVGVWGATLSSAVGSILGAPRTLQALAKDGLAPKFFARGFGPGDEPRIGLVFSFALAEVGILLGNLDVIAPILTMFFLATYGMTNLACGLERWASTPSFRPSFKVPSWLSILGALGSFYVMSIIHLPAMLGALGISALIFVYVERKDLGHTLGDAWHGIWAALVRSAILKLRSASYHPQNWRPNLLIFGGVPGKRTHLLEIGCSLVQDRGLVTYFALIRGKVSLLVDRRRKLLDQVREAVGTTHPTALARVDIVPDLYDGIVSVAQSYGIGPFEPNTVMLGWPRKAERHQRYLEMMLDLVSMDKSLLLVHKGETLLTGKRSLVHVWWGGLKGNGGLMLLLAFLLKANEQWSQAEFSVLTIVPDDEDIATLEASLGQMLEQARVDAQPVVIPRRSRSIADIMRAHSATADLAVIGLGLPQEGEEAQAFFQRTDRLLEPLPTTLLVYSAQHFQGEPVLFD